MKKLDQEMRSRALGDTIMQFNPSDTFSCVQSPIGELVELLTKNNYCQNKGEIIFSQKSQSIIALKVIGKKLLFQL